MTQTFISLRHNSGCQAFTSQLIAKNHHLQEKVILTKNDR